MRVLPLLLVALSLPAAAAGPKPEVARDTGKPQAVGAVHTVRAIPEACARLEGMFTGDAAQPYRFAAVRSSPNCQARARYVDFAKARPTEARLLGSGTARATPAAAIDSTPMKIRANVPIASAAAALGQFAGILLLPHARLADAVQVPVPAQQQAAADDDGRGVDRVVAACRVAPAAHSSAASSGETIMGRPRCSPTLRRSRPERMAFRTAVSDTPIWRPNARSDSASLMRTCRLRT